MKAHVLKEMESGLGWSIRRQGLRAHGVGAREATGRGRKQWECWFGWAFSEPMGALQVGKHPSYATVPVRSLKSTKAEAARLLKTEAQT